MAAMKFNSSENVNTNWQVIDKTKVALLWVSAFSHCYHIGKETLSVQPIKRSAKWKRKKPRELIELAFTLVDMTCLEAKKKHQTILNVSIADLKLNNKYIQVILVDIVA